MGRTLNPENNFCFLYTLGIYIKGSIHIEIIIRKESTLFYNHLHAGVFKNRKLLLYLIISKVYTLPKNMETKKDIVARIWSLHIERYFANFVYQPKEIKEIFRHFKKIKLYRRVYVDNLLVSLYPFLHSHFSEDVSIY